MHQSDHERAWARWRRVAALACSPGVFLAVLMWGLRAALVLALAVALTAAAVRLALAQPTAGRRGEEITAHAVAVLSTVPVGVALAAVASLSFAAGVLVAAGLALGAPPVRRLAARVLGAPRHGDAPDVPTRPGPPDGAARLPRQAAPVPDWAVRGLGHQRDDADARLLARPPAVLTTAELCRAWRHSFVALRRASTPGERARFTMLRQSYLDEIEIRDPAALQAWFASGARAASGPERFLAPRWPRPSSG